MVGAPNRFIRQISQKAQGILDVFPSIFGEYYAPQGVFRRPTAAYAAALGPEMTDKDAGDMAATTLCGVALGTVAALNENAWITIPLCDAFLYSP